MRPQIDVQVWSDVVCPWCYIGKRRFEAALAEVGDEMDVTVRYRAYQLDPRAPTDAPTPVAESYAKKFGGEQRAEEIIRHVTSVAAESGIEFRMDRALRANTMLAHRMLWLGGVLGVQSALKERLMKAYFTDGLDIGNPDVLIDCAVDAGIDRARAVAFLSSDDGIPQVEAQILQAAELEITAVPTFVINGSWSIPGAQDTEVFVQVLRRLAAKAAGNSIDVDA